MITEQLDNALQENALCFLLGDNVLQLDIAKHFSPSCLDFNLMFSNATACSSSKHRKCHEAWRNSSQMIDYSFTPNDHPSQL